MVALGLEPMSVWLMSPAFEPLCAICQQGARLFWSWNSFLPLFSHCHPLSPPSLSQPSHPVKPAVELGSWLNDGGVCRWERLYPRVTEFPLMERTIYCWLLPELEKALLADRVQVPPAEQAPQMSFWSRLQNKQIRFQNKRSSPHGFHYEMALALPAPGDPSNWPLVTLVPHPWSPDKAWEWPCIVLTFCCCCYPLRGQCGETVSLFGRMGLLRCLDSVYRSWQPPLVTIILWEAPGSQVQVTSCSCERLTMITYFSAVPGGRRRQLVKAALPRNRKGKLRVSPFLAKWLDNSSRSTGCRVRKFHPVWLLAAWHWESHLTLFPQL